MYGPVMSKRRWLFAQRKHISHKMEHVMELKNNVHILNLLEVFEKTEAASVIKNYPFH